MMMTDDKRPAIIESDMWEYIELVLDCMTCGRNTNRCICEDDDDE